jgi:hypothetical protein
MAYTRIIGIMEIAVPASMRFQEDAASPELLRLITPTTKGIRLGFDRVNTMGRR